MTPEALADLHARCFNVPRPFSAREFSDLAASPLVFLCPHRFGFALGRAVADEAELLTLAVEPRARRAGVARGLLIEFEAEAMLRGAQHVYLEVASINVPALALYRSSGFSESGTRRAYYRTPDGKAVDAIVMTKRLSALVNPAS